MNVNVTGKEQGIMSRGTNLSMPMLSKIKIA